MSKYQITLTPVDKFFFGGDMTFKVDNSSFKNSQFASYIIRSRMFPQQTSLLGMLRFLLLSNDKDAFVNGRIPREGQKRAKELIGEQSFKVNEQHERNNFGLIKQLSHICIAKKTNEGLKALEFELKYGDVDFKDCKGSINRRIISVPDMPKYDAKKGFETRLTNGTDSFLFYDIFKEDRRIGISRNLTTGQTEENCLFKQISYRLAEGFCFIFEAEIDMDLQSLSGNMVSIGGDNSQFIITFTKIDDFTPKGQPTEKQVHLLSPTLLLRKEAQLAKFAITQVETFRFLQTSIYANSYNILSNELKRSEVRYELYAPGSVFFFDSESAKENFIKAIEAKEEFRQIGYNEYK